MNLDLFFFGVMALIAVISALGLILQDNPVRSALSLVMVLFSIAMLFFSLHAVFIGAVQVIVYAGAIMVLFIFVIMLLNLGTPERIVDKLWVQRPAAFVLGLGMVLVFGGVLQTLPVVGHQAELPAALVGPEEIGLTLFQLKWLFPFEVVSILLLVAAVGSVMLAKRRIDG